MATYTKEVEALQLVLTDEDGFIAASVATYAPYGIKVKNVGGEQFGIVAIKGGASQKISDEDYFIIENGVVGEIVKKSAFEAAYTEVVA